MALRARRVGWCLLWAGCSGGGPGPATDDTEGVTASCAEGEVLDGADCVPEACGVGPWGGREAEAGAVFVLAGGVGSGTAEEPLGGLQAGVDLAGANGGGTVVVGAGTYVENLELGNSHDGVDLLGRCPALVTLDGSAADTPAIHAQSRSGSVSLGLAGLTITGGYIGLELAGGTMSIHDAAFTANRLIGVLIYDQAEVAIDAVEITATAEERGQYGRGLEVEGGAKVRATALDVGENSQLGVFVTEARTELTLIDSRVHGTLPDRNGAGWGGLAAGGGALIAEGLLLDGNTQLGLSVQESGTTVTMTDADIEGTLPTPEGTGGRGVDVEAGGALILSETRVTGNMDIGVYVGGANAEASLTDVTISGTTARPDGEFGRGLEVQEGAVLTGERVTIGSSAESGLVVAYADTVVHLVDAEVRGSGGRGAVVQYGGVLELERSALVENTDVGLFVGSEGSLATLLDTRVEATRSEADGTGGRGVGVQEGGAVVAEGVSIAGNAELGVYLTGGGTTVTLTDCEVRDTTPDANGAFGGGVEAHDGATLHGERVSIVGNTVAGLALVDPGSTVTLVDSEVSGTLPDAAGIYGRGVDVEGGAALTATGTLVSDNTEAGLVVSGAGTTVRLVDTEVRDTHPVPAGRGGSGLWVRTGATLTGERLVLSGNAGVGLYAGGEGTTVTLLDAEVSDTVRDSDASVAFGLLAQTGADLTATGTVVTRTAGPGLYANDAGWLTCERCTLEANAYAGALVVDGGGLVLVDTVVLAGTPDVNLGGGFGVYASDEGRSSSLLLTGTTVGPHPYAAVWLEGEGVYELYDADLSGSEGVELGGWPAHGNALFAFGGVPAWGGEGGLLLERVRFAGAGQVAVLLHDATATFLDDTWEDNAVDLVQQHCTSAPPLDGASLVGVATATICEGGDLLYDTSVGFVGPYFEEPPPLG